MIEERLDAALRIGRLRDSTLVARKVGEVRRVLVASPAYLTARGEPTDRMDTLVALARGLARRDQD